MSRAVTLSITESVPFVKGHGTRNDFVLVADPEGQRPLSPQWVAALCDRRAGIGADGLLRAVRAGALVEAGELASLPEGVEPHDWFMDYRNADGSAVQMCGNGARVFAHYLHASGLEQRAEHVIGTRAGAKKVVMRSVSAHEALIAVEMGRIRLGENSTARTVAGESWSGTAVDVGNPHLVCLRSPGAFCDLEALDLSKPPHYDPLLFPEGVNIEFVIPVSPTSARLRVYERGVGETFACGTGSVAAAAVMLRESGLPSGEVIISSPGGEVKVTLDEGGSAVLEGPSALVAHGVFDLQSAAGIVVRHEGESRSVATLS